MSSHHVRFVTAGTAGRLSTVMATFDLLLNDNVACVINSILSATAQGDLPRQSEHHVSGREYLFIRIICVPIIVSSHTD